VSKQCGGKTSKRDSVVLDVRDLRVDYYSRIGRTIAVYDTWLKLQRGEIVGIAGESGCGKSTLAWSIMRLLPANAEIVSGEVLLDGVNILSVPEGVMNTEVRGWKIAIITQNPQGALNPLFPIGTQMMDVLRCYKSRRKSSQEGWHGKLCSSLSSRNKLKTECISMLEDMEIADAHKRIDEYPHQFSGGMKQRVMVAMVLMTDPLLIIADEPTTALDVSVQANLLALLNRKLRESRIATLFISHDLRVLAGLADRIVIMYSGTVIEEALVGELLFKKALHPYTAALVACVPSEKTVGKPLPEIPGDVETLFKVPHSCVFEPRCPRATSICKEHVPTAQELLPKHYVKCWHPM